MDVTPMEEAMMQQFSANAQALQLETTLNSSSSSPIDLQTDTVKDKNEANDASADVELVSGEVPVAVKIEKCEEENVEETLQEVKSGDDHILGDGEMGKESEESGDTTTEEEMNDDGSETTDVQLQDEEPEKGGEDESISSMVCESENEKIDSVAGSLAEGNKEMVSEPNDVQNTAKQQFSCSQCSKHFKTRKTFETHMKKVHKCNFLPCKICKKGYESQEVLDEHLLKLHGVKKTKGRPRFVGPFTCDNCKKVFEKRKSFTNHSQSCGTGKVFACESCSKVFVRQDSLKSHNERHHSETPPQHQCEVCGRQFYKRDKLRRHQVIHMPTEKQPLIKKFNCETCSNRYCSRTELEIHTRTHTGEKPSLCEHCGKCFTCERDTKKHILRMHSNWRETAKLHHCSICNKSFLEKCNMLKHVSAVHADNRPFPCDQCEYRGKNKRDLQRHQNRHMEEKPFSCFVCSKRYNSNEALNYHKRAHHGMDKVYKCKDCGTEFHVREAYNHHMKSHKRASEIDTVVNLVVERQREDPEESKKEEKPEEFVEDKETKTEEVAGSSQEVATIIFVPLTS